MHGTLAQQPPAFAALQPRSIALLALGTVLASCTWDRPTASVEPPEAVTAPRATVRRVTREVRVIYLVPIDREMNREYVRVLRAAVENLQLWYQQHGGTGETFTLAKPVVEVIHTAHEASWYAAMPSGGSDPSSLWFWFNVTAEGRTLAEQQTKADDDILLFYIEADPACGQATGAVGGYALLPANDLRGLAGEPILDLCSGSLRPNEGTCRWVGGLGHELGYAIALPHPPGCEAGDASCATWSLMWFGWITYPDAYFTSTEQSLLDASGFMNLTGVNGRVRPCDALAGGSRLSGAAARMSAARSPMMPPACASRKLASALSVHGASTLQ